MSPVIDAHPEYEKAALLERMVEPERTIEFRVRLGGRSGQGITSTAATAFSSTRAIGPYKGGLRFASLRQPVHHQVPRLRAGLQGQPDRPAHRRRQGRLRLRSPSGKSDAEVMRFCQAFMTELYRHIGPGHRLSPPATWACGGREIGYLYGQYRRIDGAVRDRRSDRQGPCATGGSMIRPEATGFGAVYYVAKSSKHDGKDPSRARRIAMSGFGNVGMGHRARRPPSWAQRSSPCPAPTATSTIPTASAPRRRSTTCWRCAPPAATRFRTTPTSSACEFMPGEKPWGRSRCDIIMPCRHPERCRYGRS